MKKKVYNNAWEWLFEDKITWVDEEMKHRVDDYAEFLAHLHALCDNIKVHKVTYFRDGGAIKHPMINASKYQQEGRLHKNATFTLHPEGRWKASCSWTSFESATLLEGDAIEYARSYFTPHLVDEEWVQQTVDAWKKDPGSLRLGQFLIGNYVNEALSNDKATHHCHTLDIFHYEADTWQQGNHVIEKFKRRFCR